VLCYELNQIFIKCTKNIQVLLIYFLIKKIYKQVKKTYIEVINSTESNKIE
jgi:hypothetical protein